MKKQFIFILASIFTMLFAACSQENELDAPGGEKSNLVSVSTQLPADFAKTRALPGAADHQLRCILEVWSTGENVALIHRLEKKGTAGADNITFDFTLDSEGDYDCLMWADFIAAEAAATDGKFPDMYYTTTDLKAIAVKDLTKLFNNDACDAFFAKEVLTKTTAAGTLGAKLTRPFAKLTLMENAANAAMFTTCTNVAVSYDVPTKFNVVDGSVSESKTATHTATPIKGEKNVYFTNYILAGANDALGNISLVFTAAVGTDPIEKVIPSGVPTKRNFRTNATGYLMGEKPANSTDASVKVEIDDKFTGDEANEPEAGDKPVDPNALAVGDFYYSDGSYSHTYDSENICVGIVFAVGEQQGDAIGNYTETELTGEIKGYVLAALDFAYTDATNALPKTSKIYNVATYPVDAPASLSSASTTDFAGYANSQAFVTWRENVLAGGDKNFQAIEAYVKHVGNANNAVAGTSGWYIPTIGQWSAIMGNYWTKEGNVDGIIKTNLTILEASNKGKDLYSITGGKYSYLSCTPVIGENKVYRADIFSEVYETAAVTPNGSGCLRFVLTF